MEILCSENAKFALKNSNHYGALNTQPRILCSKMEILCSEMEILPNAMESWLF